MNTIIVKRSEQNFGRKPSKGSNRSNELIIWSDL